MLRTLEDMQLGRRRYIFLGMLLCRYPANNYLFKVSNRNRIMCEICSKLTIKTPERRHFI